MSRPVFDDGRGCVQAGAADGRVSACVRSPELALFDVSAGCRDIWSLRSLERPVLSDL